MESSEAKTGTGGTNGYNGYTGKILQLDLTAGTVSVIETKKYQQWVGGHGMGSAIFWDLVQDKSIDGFDARNVVTIMTSPLTGTLCPGGASRVEIQGIGVQSHPIGWFTRSNMGGRFGAMLKFSGWDGIVIQGKAERPVWVDIRNDEVRIRDAGKLWGLDTWRTQRRIWKEVCGKVGGDSWTVLGEQEDSARTTQRPAVMAIGPAGEKLSRLGAIIHDAGNAAGQGGFGGVLGSKNLKAISVIGSSSVGVSRPADLLQAQAWFREHYTVDKDDPAQLTDDHSICGPIEMRDAPTVSALPLPIVFWRRRERSRPQACIGCPAGCRARNDTGQGNESGCAESIFYSYPDLRLHSQAWVRAVAWLMESFAGEGLAFLFTLLKGRNTTAYAATDLCQKLGINAFELMTGVPYLRDLNKKGVLGPGKQIDCDLPFDRFGEKEFADKLLHMIASREGIGDDLAEGFYRAAEKWGRLEEDLKTGLLNHPHWGLPNHYDPRCQTEWGYGTILGDRDINEHGFNILYWMPTIAEGTGIDPSVSAEQAARIYSDRMAPYQGDPLMLDYGSGNLYSEHVVKLVAWHRYYTRFWKQSALYCDFLFPDFLNPARKDKRGMVGEGEQKFLNAVVGVSFEFTDGIELGKKIWNLDNAIWTLQGRHRKMVRFADFIYQQPLEGPAYLPARKEGKWQYVDVSGRSLDEKKFEQWKTRYYDFEGWDRESGWPRRKTLEDLGLQAVAEELEKRGKLGKG